MERFSFNAVNKTLTITSGYAKKLNDMASDEFKHYNSMMQAIPGLVVVNRSHRSPSKCTSKSTGETFSCNQFKNLKYENMERFMSALPNSKEYFAEYAFLRQYATRKKMFREYQERQEAAQRAKEEAERDAIIPTLNFKSTVRVIK